MKFLTVFIALALAITLSTAAYNGQDAEEAPLGQPSYSLPRANQFLAQNTRPAAAMTCNVYPRICRAKGSPGPDCCKKKCVNVATDRLNCGNCGRKCKYAEICCKGQCVNPMTDKKNCGGCNNKCKKGSKCMYGMCSYA